MFLRYILHQHRPQTVGYTLGHILCLFSLNATDLRCLCGFIWFLSPNGDDMPVWFQSAPAPGLDHDYGQITTCVVLLGVQAAGDVRSGYLGGRRRRRRRVPAPVPAPAPGLHHDYGQITTSVVLLGVQVTDVRRGYLGGRRRRRQRVPAPAPAPVPASGLHHDYGQITTSVVLLGVQFTDVRRGYLGGRRRRRRRVPAPAPAPGLHHDYGQITTSVVLLGVQVTDVRREATWEDAGAAPASPGAGAGKSWRQRRRRDYIMTVVLLGVQVTDVRRGCLGGRRQVPAPRDYIMTMARPQPL